MYSGRKSNLAYARILNNYNISESLIDTTKILYTIYSIS